MPQEIANSPQAPSYSWSEVWIKALTRPSVETYQSIVNDPRARPNRAYIWVAVAGLIGYVIATALQIIWGTILALNFAVNPSLVQLLEPSYGPGARYYAVLP
jgi:hypothetical protein